MSTPTLAAGYFDLVERYPGVKSLHENLIEVISSSLNNWLNPEDERAVVAYPEVGILCLNNFLGVDAVSLLKKPKLKMVETRPGHNIAHMHLSPTNTAAASILLGSTDKIFGEPTARLFYNRYDVGCTGGAHTDPGALQAIALFAKGTGRLRVDASADPAANVALANDDNDAVFAQLVEQGRTLDIYNGIGDIVIAGDLQFRLHNGGWIAPQDGPSFKRETIGFSAII